MARSRIEARFSLEGYRALVTGGSLSIGRAIALGLAEAGADVAIQSAEAADDAFGLPGAAAETEAEITALGRRAMSIRADFSIADAARTCVKQVRNTLGGPDILVICASVQSRHDLAAITRDEIDRQVSINFAATVELLQEVLPAMTSAGWGRVLSIGSVNQTRPEAQLGVYAALKAAQHNLIMNLARQYASSGVTINTLSPGLVATERNRWRRGEPTEWAQIEQHANPMGRAASPDEMVGAAVLLCSPSSSFITGTDLQVTGGAHL